MFASRNTDGNEMSWSGINKRWVRKPGWSHRIFQLSTLFKSNAAAFSPVVCLSKNHLISLVKNGNLLFKVELFVSGDERHLKHACMTKLAGGEKSMTVAKGNAKVDFLLFLDLVYFKSCKYIHTWRTGTLYIFAAALVTWSLGSLRCRISKCHPLFVCSRGCHNNIKTVFYRSFSVWIRTVCCRHRKIISDGQLFLDGLSYSLSKLMPAQRIYF